MFEIAPSILSADFTRLADEIASVKAGGATIVHVDVMDGHFVPNITIGLPVVRSIREATDLIIDTHLMIEHPGQYAVEFVKAGANMVSVHVEADAHAVIARLSRSIADARFFSYGPLSGDGAASRQDGFQECGLAAEVRADECNAAGWAA